MEIVAEERTSDHPMIINGELVQGSSGMSDPVINPATGEAFDYVPHGTREDLDRAVDAAAEAFKTWSTTPFEERAACLMKFSALVEAKAEELATAMTMEQGKPLNDSLREVMGICSKCKEFTEIGDLKSETVSEDDDAEYKLVYTPRGVIGGITPWNVRSVHLDCESPASRTQLCLTFPTCLSVSDRHGGKQAAPVCHHWQHGGRQALSLHPTRDGHAR